MPGGGPYPPYCGRAGALDPNTNARASSTIGLLGFINKPKGYYRLIYLPAAITVGTAK